MITSVFLFGACSQPAELRVRLRTETPGDQEIVAEAVRFWGLEPVFVTDSRRAVTIELLEKSDRGGTHRGRALIRSGCRRAFWAWPRTVYVAHEIGHVLGLGHEPDTVMAERVGRDEDRSTEEQDRVVLRSARRLSIMPCE